MAALCWLMVVSLSLRYAARRQNHPQESGSPVLHLVHRLGQQLVSRFGFELHIGNHSGISMYLGVRPARSTLSEFASLPAPRLAGKRAVFQRTGTRFARIQFHHIQQQRGEQTAVSG